MNTIDHAHLAPLGRSTRLLACLLGLLAFVQSHPGLAQDGPGDLESGFDPGTILASGGQAAIHGMLVESNGNVIVVGDFTTIEGVARDRIARFGPDGTLDGSFAASTGADGPIHCIAIQENGRILIGGDFMNYGGTARSRVARLLPNGTLDSSFDPGTGANGPVHAIVELEGLIWAGGDFTEFNEIALNRIVQLTPNGLPYGLQRVTGGCNGPVHVFAKRAAYPESLFIGGEFTMIGGEARNRIAQIDEIGRLEEPVTEGTGPDGPVFALALEASSRSSFSDFGLLIGGSFTSVDGETRGGLARINMDQYYGGSLDPFFSIWANGAVRAIHLQQESSYNPPSGVLIGGDFTALNGLPRQRIARLSLTGAQTPDYPYEEGFVAQVDGAYAAGGGADGTVFALGGLSDGTHFAAGNFANVSGSPRTSLAHLYGEFGSSLPGTPGAPQAVPLSDDAIHLSWTSASSADNHGVERSPNGIDSWTSAGSATSSFTDDELDPGVEYFYRIIGTNPNGSGTPSPVVSATTEALDWTGPGALDPATGFSADGTVYATAQQPDGKILIAGSFYNVAGTPRRAIARLNADWTLDTTFDPGVGPSSSVYAIDVAADGKILIAGSFSRVADVDRTYVARLLPDGSLDAGFDPGVGPSSTVYAVAAQDDGRVLIGGFFSRVAGYSQNGLARLNVDGSLDMDFRTSPTSTVYCIEVLPDGRILIGGSFYNVTGIARRGIARILADGTVDESFDPGAGGTTVYCIAVMNDGRIVVGGTFSSFDGTTRRRVARLEANGALDTGFDPGTGPNSTVEAVALDSAGRVIIGGRFTEVDDEPRFRIARLELDGSLDPSFRTGSGFNNTVETVLVQADGKIVVGGSFSSFEGVSHGRATRLVGGSTGGPTLDYAQWVLLHFDAAEAADPSISGPEVDFDQDGMSNLLESAFGGNPKLADAAERLPMIVIVEGRYEYRFYCDANRNDIDYTVEASTNPASGPWPGIALSPAGAIVTSPGGECLVLDPGSGLRQVTLTGVSTVTAEPMQTFRVRIEERE